MKLKLSKETMRSLATKTGMRTGTGVQTGIIVPVNGSGLFHCIAVFDGQISAATPCNPLGVGRVGNPGPGDVDQ